MDAWVFLLWMVLNFLCVVAHEVTVKGSDLQRCENDKQVCVVDRQDCPPPPPSAHQKNVNVSCYYQNDVKSVTCEWKENSRSPTVPKLSLIFRKEDFIYTCRGIINRVAILMARMKISVVGAETWSQTFTLDLSNLVKPSRPELIVLGSTDNSLDVTWISTGESSCRLRYRANGTNTWRQVASLAAAYLPSEYEDQNLTYSIKDLLPFTVYQAAVACTGNSNIWSSWSLEVTARTLDTIPSRPVEICYTVEKTEAGGSFHLHLRWQDRNLCDPGGRVLGYEVSWRPDRDKQLQETLTRHVLNMTAVLDVKEGKYNITVRAFNTAGYGPAAQLHADVQREDPLPPVRNLWVSSYFPTMNAVRVHWQATSGPPVSHFHVQWYSESRPSSCWITEDSWNSSALIEDIDPDGAYLISVTPVYEQRCGPSRTLPASLQHGALMEAVQMKVLDKTKRTVTVGWVWQRKPMPIRVDGYRVMLRRGSETQAVSLWPDQEQHTFYDLQPNTEYYLLLLADNVSRHTTTVKTDFDEVPVVAAATPLLLLAVAVFLISFLCSSVRFRSYFFPTIASPLRSKVAHWLKNPTPQKPLDRRVLDIEDFRVVDVLGDKDLIVVGPRLKCSSKEDLPEEASPLMHTLKLDSVCVSELALQEDSTTGGLLHKLEEKSLNQFLEESCQDPHFADLLTNQSSHMTCDTEYIFVEQISSALKQ